MQIMTSMIQEPNKGFSDIYLRIATKAAKSAGKLLLNECKNSFKVSYKSEKNIVTEIDLKAEKLIIETIRERFPDHAIVAEESGENTGSPPDKSHTYKWYIDPLDGTTNYAHGFPCFCVSIGLEKDGDLILGVVYQPVLKELFVAKKGYGAFLNGIKLGVSKTSMMGESLLATGFPYKVKEDPDLHMARFKEFMLASLAIRRAGSAAIDLCYVAAGRFDGFWEAGLARWDIAAGTLMVTEAGGIVTDFNKRNHFMEEGEIVASNGLIHDSMLNVLSNIKAPTAMEKSG